MEILGYSSRLKITKQETVQLPDQYSLASCYHVPSQVNTLSIPSRQNLEITGITISQGWEKGQVNIHPNSSHSPWRMCSVGLAMIIWHQGAHQTYHHGYFKRHPKRTKFRYLNLAFVSNESVWLVIEGAGRSRQ